MCPNGTLRNALKSPRGLPAGPESVTGGERLRHRFRAFGTIGGINRRPAGVLSVGVSFRHMVFRRRSLTSSDRRGGAAAAGSAPEARDDDDAFAAEALSYIDSLYGTAMRLTRRAADAEDLVQDTYLKAFRSAAQFERGTNLKAWLFTILHNTFRNMRRHDGRNPIDVDSEAVEQAAGDSAREFSPEQLLTRASLDQDLQAALDALPETFRQAVWLRDVEELTYAEIARVLDVPIGTVMSRISRGRRALFERLAGQRAVVGEIKHRAPSPGDADAPGKTEGGRQKADVV
jgi:RNA polymerase sigma-70 factor (ECF subfamily)